MRDSGVIGGRSRPSIDDDACFTHVVSLFTLSNGLLSMDTEGCVGTTTCIRSCNVDTDINRLRSPIPTTKTAFATRGTFIAIETVVLCSSYLMKRYGTIQARVSGKRISGKGVRREDHRRAMDND